MRPAKTVKFRIHLALEDASYMDLDMPVTDLLKRLIGENVARELDGFVLAIECITSDSDDS